MKNLMNLLETASLLFLPARDVDVSPHFLFCVMKSKQISPEKICERFSERSYLRDNSLAKECQNFMLKNWEPESLYDCSIFIENNDADEIEILNRWDIFTDYMFDFNKVYQNIDEVHERYSIFHDNLEFINEHNDGNHSYKLGINQYADWSNSEFKNYVSSGSFGLGMKTTCPKAADVSGALPSSVDWRDKGIVNTPMQQGSVGTCYSFSTTASMEGALAQKTGTFTKLSEQAIVDCAGIMYGDMGINGGSMEGSFNFIHDNGIPTEESYPYMAKQGTCQKYTSVVKNSGCYEVPANELQVTYVVSQRVVSIAVQADSRSFQLYSSGVFDDSKCYSGSLDHGVALVGYGHDSSSNKDYYILRNSWDTTWGESGYMRIKRNSVASSTEGMCGLAMMSSYPVL